MGYIDDNVSMMDCLVVAIYNCNVAKGGKLSYSELKNICTYKGWYAEYIGFNIRYIGDALKHFGIEFQEIKEIKKAKDFSRKIRQGNSAIVIMQPVCASICHAFFTMKGKKGVKAYNSLSPGTGWRTICKGFKEKRFTMYEVAIS